MSFKTICVGLPKTGTTTLHNALASTGMYSCHHIAFKRSGPAGALMVQAMNEGRPINTYLPYVEAVTQLDSAGKHVHAWPQCNEAFLRQFRAEFPDALVILHTRDPDKTIHSIQNWSNLWDRLRKSAPGLHEKASRKEVKEWILGHYENMRRIFRHDPYFIEFDIEDPGAPVLLGDALAREIKWWGVANEGKWRE